MWKWVVNRSWLVGSGKWLGLDANLLEVLRATMGPYLDIVAHVLQQGVGNSGPETARTVDNVFLALVEFFRLY